MSDVREEFFADLEDNFGSSIATIRLKNADYSTENDPFRNFRRSAEFAGVSIERALLIRIFDKMARFENLLTNEEAGENGPAVSDETTEDTLRDLLGYINIMTVYRQWKRQPVEGYLYSGAPGDYPETAEEDEPEDYDIVLVPEEPTEQDGVPTEEPEPEIIPPLSARQKLLNILSLK